MSEYADYLKKLRADKNAIAIFELQRAIDRVNRGVATPEERLIVANSREKPRKAES